MGYPVDGRRFLPQVRGPPVSVDAINQLGLSRVP
jgi:hypothetical protein